MHNMVNNHPPHHPHLPSPQKRERKLILSPFWNCYRNLLEKIMPKTGAGYKACGTKADYRTSKMIHSCRCGVIVNIMYIVSVCGLSCPVKTWRFKRSFITTLWGLSMVISKPRWWVVRFQGLFCDIVDLVLCPHRLSLALTHICLSSRQAYFNTLTSSHVLSWRRLLIDT